MPPHHDRPIWWTGGRRDTGQAKMWSIVIRQTLHKRCPIKKLVTPLNSAWISDAMLDSPRGMLDAIILTITLNQASNKEFSVAEAESLCTGVQSLFLSEPTLLELQGPMNICGDLHGQLADLIRCFQFAGLPPYVRWLFLGDYVDRGPESVEVLCFLFALKCRYPAHVFLIRGNHETRDMSEVGGLYSECVHKLNESVWNTFCKVFDVMPLAVVLSNKFFCVHGGIGPKLETLQQIRTVRRPLFLPESSIVMDMLWSDPSPDVTDFKPSPRGGTFLWGLGAAERFLSKTGLQMIVRAHQVAVNGYDYPFFPSKLVVTVFTASNYSESARNRAALMAIDEVGEWELRVVPSSIAWKHPVKTAGMTKAKKPSPFPAVEKEKPPAAIPRRPRITLHPRLSV
jgi:serine/threonine-protein phosphatase PP1 catalytic subunit